MIMAVFGIVVGALSNEGMPLHSLGILTLKDKFGTLQPDLFTPFRSVYATAIVF
jgi:hypothetical protein